MYAFTVAVVGECDGISSEHLEQLLELLVNRHSNTHRITLVTTPGSPELRWCQDRGWSLQFVPLLRSPVKRDCELVATVDAVVVLGDPARWSRLLRLCAEARIPTRVYNERPQLPSRNGLYPTE